MNINFLDVLFHIANIVILYVLLRLILYKPVQKFMKERSERIQNKIAEADNAKSAIMEEKERYDKKFSEIEEDKKRLLREVQKKANEKADKIISEANKQAELIISEAREQAQLETEKTMEKMQEQIADAAIEIASRILNREISEKDNYALVTEFFAQVR